jgi:hypothetical protein
MREPDLGRLVLVFVGTLCVGVAGLVLFLAVLRWVAP